MNALGARLREERDRLGKSQEEFAAIGGVKRGAQANYEKDERSPDAAYLAAVAEHGVDVLYVITGVRTSQAAQPLSAEEMTLLDHYQHADDEGRAAARTVLAALSQVAGGAVKKRA